MDLCAPTQDQQPLTFLMLALKVHTEKRLLAPFQRIAQSVMLVMDALNRVQMTNTPNAVLVIIVTPVHQPLLL